MIAGVADRPGEGGGPFLLGSGSSVVRGAWSREGGGGDPPRRSRSLGVRATPAGSSRATTGQIASPVGCVGYRPLAPFPAATLPGYSPSSERFGAVESQSFSGVCLFQWLIRGLGR